MIDVAALSVAFGIRAEDLASDLAISSADIDLCITRQPGLFAYYSSALAKAEAHLRQAKLDRDVYIAALDRSIRDKALARSQKLTEKQIEMQVMLDLGWRERMERVNALEAAASQLDGLVRAFAHRKDMIVTLATNMRHERQQPLAIREQPEGASHFQPPR